MIDAVALTRTLEQALRAGFSLRQALARAAGDFAHPMLQEAAKLAEAGMALDHLLDRWAATDGDIALLAGAIRLQLDAGGNLADRFAVLADIMERRPVDAEPTG